MKNLMTIEVKSYRLFAVHGVHDDEALLPVEYEINASVDFVPEKDITSIHDTIDYMEIEAIIRTEMKSRKQLLETVAQAIAARLKTSFPYINRIHLSIKKLTPAVANFKGNVGVSLSRDFTV